MKITWLFRKLAVLILCTLWGVSASAMTDQEASSLYDAAAGGDAISLDKLSNAARSGDAWAQGYLGHMYENGQGVPQDYAQAAFWHNKAAEQGMYAKGKSVPTAVDYGGWSGSVRGSPQDVKPKDDTQQSNSLVIILIGAIVLGLYFIPAIVASGRSHPNTTSILILNLFLGWTGLGWIIALIWANTAIRKDIAYKDD